MAIIYSYPRNVDILPTDVIVGTTTKMFNGKPKNETKNFKMGDIANYVTMGYVPYVGAYADVVLGNHALSVSNETITTLLSPSLGISISGDDKTTIINESNLYTFHNILGTSSKLTSAGLLELRTNGVATGTLSATNLTSNITLLFPDKPAGSYIIAVEGEPGTIYNLQQVTDAGNTTTNDIILNSTPGEHDDYTAQNTINDIGSFLTYLGGTPDGDFYADYNVQSFSLTHEPSAGGYTSIIGSNGNIGMSANDPLNVNSNGSINLSSSDGAGSPYLQLYNKIAKSGYLKATNLTNNVTLQFPDKATGTYTIATTADIPSISGTTNYIPKFTGANSLGDSNILESAGTTYINYSARSLLDGNSCLSVQRGQSQIDIALGNPDISQVNSIISDNSSGLELKSKGTLSLKAGSSYTEGINVGTTGKLIFTQTPDTGTTSDKLLLRDSSGNVKQITYPTIPTVGTWGALNYPTWTTGTPFVKMTAAGTFALDTNIYLTSITSSDVTTALGYTPVTNARTLTINGVGYDLTADRSWTISTSSSPLTTKGDLYTFSTVDARLPLGSNTQILTVDTSTPTGMKWAAPPTATPTGYYGAFQDNTIQTAVAINTPYAMRFGVTDLSNAVTMVSDGSNLTRITIANTGIYNIQFSAQFDRTNSGTDVVDIWLRKNGVDVSGTGGKIVLAGGVVASAIIATWNYVLDVVAGDYYQLMWSTPDTHVRLLYEPAQTSPFVHPLIPSTILTVTQQSGIMAGTGITAINSLTGTAQTLTTGTTGIDFAIVDSGTEHKFNLPTASAAARGALSSTDWTTFNEKQSALSGTGLVKSTTGTITYITDNSTNWDTAYADRNKWDGGSTGLVAATGRTSLGLGTFAVKDYPTWTTGTPFVKMTAAGTFDLDTNTYLTSVGTGVTNQLTYWSGTNTLGSLSTTTYPSLTEISYVKGVTSAIQTQLNAKIAGIHTLRKPAAGTATSNTIGASAMGIIIGVANRLLVSPYIPAVSFTCASLYTNVTILIASALGKIVIYSDLNGVPDQKLFASSDLDFSTTGIKTAPSSTFAFVAGTTYWIGLHTSSTATTSAIPVANALCIGTSGITNYTGYLGTTTYASGAPTTFGATPTLSALLMPFIGITI